MIVDGRTSAGREFLCQAGFHGGWVETEFPVVLLARSAIADLLGGRMNGLLEIPTTPGTLLVIAIGAGSEDGSATIAAKEVRYQRPLWMPGA